MIYYTGCDAHKKTSALQHMDSEGTLGLSMRVPTDKDGFNKFFDQLDRPTEMTLEAGRNYWWLHEFFKDHPKVTQVNVVDPRRARNLAQELSVLNGYGRAKTDEIDSEMLADMTRRELAPAIHVPTAKQLELRTICRHRFTSVMNRTRAKNHIHSILALHGFSVNLDDLSIDLNYRDKIKSSIPDYVSFIIGQLLDRIYMLDQQVGYTENKLKQLLPESNSQMKILTSAPGIGPVLARMAYSEILDIAYFKAPKYLISYSGLAIVENDSDGRKGRLKLNRHCNYYLKYVFVEAAHNASDHPKYRRKYDIDKKKQGKIIAKLNLARRLAKAVYWMLTRQQLFKK
jgi:transposase